MKIENAYKFFVAGFAGKDAGHVTDEYFSYDFVSLKDFYMRSGKASKVNGNDVMTSKAFKSQVYKG